MTQRTVAHFTEGMDVAGVEAFALRLEALGYDGLWVPEVSGREPVALAAHLLARTTRLNVGIGVANVYVRDYVAAAQARQTLAELSGGRFWLGLGVSHPVLVEPRGHRFLPPARALRDYLRGIHATRPDGPRSSRPAPIICAAHGPKLLELVREHADGAFCLNQPPEHTAWARTIIGPDKKLCVVVRTCLESDPVLARRHARNALNFYVGLPAYHRAWQRAGFEPGDFVDGGSDRLIDAIIAWGDAAAIRARIQAHIDAGASEICLYPINPNEHLEDGQVGGYVPDWNALEAFAPGR
ncbi:MAG: LLM class flavin-dependent oxidoreductase [Gammaproteobacteria bacterium]|nr:LLM class flavin-dependent oxidoreductase [Gammaproteobacteria bacterium]